MRAAHITVFVWPLLFAGPLAGQQIDLCDATTGQPREPDVVLRASVTADRIRFESDPEVEVRLSGCSVLDTVRVLERTNLPDPVEPGVTYENVEVAVEILGHLDIDCVIGGAAADSTGVALGAALRSLCGSPPDSVPLRREP